MRIVLLCATRRGYRFLEKLAGLVPGHELFVFSFREESWEPPFLDSIRELTEAVGGKFFEAKQVGSSRYAEFWETTDIDLLLVVSWRYLLSPEIYQRPRLGTFVFHDSLLPAYRGFSPTVWAIINGESQTGVTLFNIAAEVDAGDIVDQQSVPIGSDDTIAQVMEKVTQIYMELLERNLMRLLTGDAPRTPQDHARATYTCKRVPQDNLIDWHSTSDRIYNLIRAVTAPYPGTYTYLGGRKLRVWSASKVDSQFVGCIPGRVARVLPGMGAVVLTGDGALLLKDMQLNNEDIACAAEILDNLGITLGS